MEKTEENMHWKRTIREGGGKGGKVNKKIRIKKCRTIKAKKNKHF